MIGRVLNRFNIGGKLNIGFGILVVLTLLVVGLSYLASSRATTNIKRTTDISAPTALASARAQANLLTMLADVRGYLALGDEEYRVGYEDAKTAFEADLAELETLAGQQDPGTNPEFDRQLQEIKMVFAQWEPLPGQLFALRDDQLQREPALRLLLEDANPLIATILINISRTIATHRQQPELTNADVVLLGEMNDFQTSFFAMVAGLRGYVTTGRDNFKFEYTSNAAINQKAWEKLLSDQNRLNINQQARLGQIGENREAFLELPPQMFEAVEGERAREDLYLFRTDAVPLANTMLQLLSEMTINQQSLLQSDLTEGRTQLSTAQWQMLAGGAVALLVALALAYIFRENIAGPVRRLTHAAEQIGHGDLSVRAPVESSDEIGTLAQTFNRMTNQLGSTMADLEQRGHDLQVAADTLRGQNEYLSALHDTSLALLNRLDLNELLETLVTRAGQLLDAPYGYIYLVDPQAHILELKVAVGVSERQIGDQMQPGEGLAGKVWQSGQPVVVDDYDNWPGRSPEIRFGLIRALAGVPLTRGTGSGSRVMGVVGLGYTAASKQTFDAEKVEVLDRFAQLASIALDNARLFAETQLARSEAEVARAEAEQANAAKSAFLANMSHELRTPLNAIIGFTRIVKRKATGTLPDKQVDNLDKVLVSAEHLLSLINTVLDIAKIEAGRMDVVPVEFDAEKLVDLCAVTAQPLLRRGVDLVKDIEPELPLVYSDQDKIKQIILNLLSNAAKFTHEGTVRIKTYRQEEMLVVDVTDSGIGIGEEALPRVFEEFQQADSSTTRQYGGTGLGLPISRKLAQLLGGDLVATSVEGQGSTFTLAVPLRYVEVTGEPTIVPAGA